MERVELQAALGRQPRMVGDVLGGVQQRLAEHGLIDSKPSLARQLALREVAKVAMTRLHFSRRLRKAELARSRNPTVQDLPEPGSICYFYRPLRFNRKDSASRKRLSLKRWHGPALMVAREGNSNAFLSHKGQLTKCALEHVRKASTMEQIAAGTWREAIEEAVETARLELAAPKPGEAPVLSAVPEENMDEDDEVPNPATPGFLPSSSATMIGDGAQALHGDDLPPAQAKELLPIMIPSTPAIPSQVGSTIPSRRMSGLESVSPFPDAVRRAHERRVSEPVPAGAPERALPADASDGGGTKRAAETDAEQLRREDVDFGTVPGSSSEALQADRLPGEEPKLSREQLQHLLQQPNLHPLSQAFYGACLDQLDPLESEVKDHGTWSGRWGLPSRSEWQTFQRLGMSWPTGAPSDHEVQAAQATRKEFHWKQMSAEEKEAFTKAAKEAWSVWEENDAIEILSEEESAMVRKRVAANREDGRVLTPRYVFTDSHESLRTKENPLPLKARARVIVPGYKDVFSFALRKDAPTGSRISQHITLPPMPRSSTMRRRTGV